MKKHLFLLAAAMFCIFSCQEKPEDASSISANVTLKVTAEAGVAAPAKYKVTFTNSVDKFELVKEVESTEFLVEDLLGGNYTISVLGEADGRFFTGNASNVIISKSKTPVTIEVKATRPSGLVLKEIYYCLPPKVDGQIYKDDNFYEIYNNSENDQILDGLCLGQVMPTAASSIYTFDTIDNPDNFVFCGVIWQIPNEGGKYILKPGESAVIASVAIDHIVNNPGSVDLSKADFEAYITNQTLYADHDNIPNLNLVFGSFGIGAERWLATYSGPATVLFAPEGEIDNSTFVTPKGNKTQLKDIPVSWVLDAVEAMETEKGLNFKRIPASLDAGGIWMPYTSMELMSGVSIVSTGYLGSSISRKVKETKADGRIIYQDTDNTTNDFVVCEKAATRRDNSGIPSWSPAYAAPLQLR